MTKEMAEKIIRLHIEKNRIINEQWDILQEMRKSIPTMSSEDVEAEAMKFLLAGEV